MRIVGGALAGRIFGRVNPGTRPTSDRVREAVGSVVSARRDFEGAAVLDLFAGTGGYGIEALSRGAAAALFVEKEKRAAYHSQLEVNRKDYAERVQTIQQISQSRRLWSKFCDDLIDVVSNNGDTERHLAWFRSITVKNDPKKGATVTMPGAVQEADSSRVANFHDDLESAPFAADLLGKSDPTWRLEIDKVRNPAQSLSFPLVLQFKPTVKDVAPAKADAKNPAKNSPAAPPTK